MGTWLYRLFVRLYALAAPRSPAAAGWRVSRRRHELGSR